MTLPNRLRELRKRKGLTLDQVAEAIGISGAHMSELERGKKNLNSVRIAQLASFYGVEPADIVGGGDPRIEEIRSIFGQLTDDQIEAVLHHARSYLPRSE